MTLVGRTALSVEIMTNASTPERTASSTTVRVPKTLFLIASPGLASIIGTCLWAAAWRITSGRHSLESGTKARRVPDRSDQGNHLGVRGQWVELSLEVEQTVLAMVEKNEPFGLESQYLATELRANASCCSGDQNVPASEGSRPTASPSRWTGSR